KEKLSAKVEMVEGGEHRQESVANALAKLNAEANDIVLVHDAVRPFVDDEIIANVVREVQKHGAAIAALPAVDTIKQVDRTAEGSLVERTGESVSVVMGSPRNIKITTPADLELAEFLMASRRTTNLTG